MGQIPFNKPCITGLELVYIEDVLNSNKLSGNGKYTDLCQKYFEKNYGFKKAILTTSCTDALEMCAILANLSYGDEVIIPSYTFVSTALAFIREGAKIVFADSSIDNPNIDVDKIESLITDRTKVIVPVHYAGVSCDMDKLMSIANKHNLLVIEDAAQAVDSFYKGRPLGGIGHLAAFSFHETKNITSGEGGLLVINDEKFIRRAEIIWEKGTNRAEFFRGEINKYGWVDTGSSFLPSELNAAFLYAQLENLNVIQNRRINLWNTYYNNLSKLCNVDCFKLPFIPFYASNNAHMFYLICNNLNDRSELIKFLKNKGVNSFFHYLSLHNSEYYKRKHDSRSLPQSDIYTDCLLRLPLYADLEIDEINYTTSVIEEFYNK